MPDFFKLGKGLLFVAVATPVTALMSYPIIQAIFDALTSKTFIYNLFTGFNVFFHILVLFLGFYMVVWGVPGGLDKITGRLGGQ